MTTTPIPIYSQAETFYVPRFEVYIQNEKLRANIVDDILQVTYKDSINEIDSFTIEINNWDAEKRTFKFAPPQKGFEGIFDPGKKIELKMGYYNNMRRMMRGVITGLEPSFPESGASTLSIHGLNELHKYRTEQHTDSWIDGKKTDTQIAEDLCKRPVKKGQAGLGLEIDPQPLQGEAAKQVVYMNSQYDIVFLQELAHRNGYDMYLEDETAKPTLFFGLSGGSADKPVYQLEWGKSLISFRPAFSTADQFGEVILRGWDRKANGPIEEPYKLADLWKDEKKTQAEIKMLTGLAKAFNDRTKVVTHQPIHNKSEARILARAILADINHRMITASGATVGLPDLRMGCSVEILGFAVRNDPSGTPKGMSNCFDGEYFVESSTHTIGGNGYRTEFTARRVGDVTGRQDES
jgi:phage protein D